MTLAAPRIRVPLIVCLFLIAAPQGHAETNDTLTSSVTTLEEFVTARDLGDQAESFEVEAQYWRHALSWPEDHVEWLRLAHRFAGSLRDEWHNTGIQGQAPHLDHPYYRESESIYREILDRFDHMDLYVKNGADNLPDDSLLVPTAASIGLNDYPLFLSMMQDFHDRRVTDWLAEPVPVKERQSDFFLESRYKHMTHDQRVVQWLERRLRALEGRVFSFFEILLIDAAVQSYGHRCRNQNDDFDPVPGLADLATRYTAPAIATAIQRYVEVESPPFPRIPVEAGKVVELTIHSVYISDNQSVGASKLDFDTGTVVTNPMQWSHRVQQSTWMKRGGLDIEVDHHWDYLMWLIAFDFELIEVPVELWSKNATSWEQLKASEVKSGVLSSGGRGEDQTQYMVSANAGLPATFAFQTREGGIGLLQLTGMKETSNNVREYSIRYRLSEAGKLDP